MPFPDDVVKDAWELVEGGANAVNRPINTQRVDVTNNCHGKREAKLGGAPGKHAPLTEYLSMITFPTAKFFAGTA